MKGFPKSFETAIGAFLFVAVSVIVLTQIARRIPQIGALTTG